MITTIIKDRVNQYFHLHWLLREEHDAVDPQNFVVRNALEGRITELRYLITLLDGQAQYDEWLLKAIVIVVREGGSPTLQMLLREVGTTLCQGKKYWRWCWKTWKNYMMLHWSVVMEFQAGVIET